MKFFILLSVCFNLFALESEQSISKYFEKKYSQQVNTYTDKMTSLKRGIKYNQQLIKKKPSNKKRLTSYNKNITKTISNIKSNLTKLQDLYSASPKLAFKVLTDLDKKNAPSTLNKEYFDIKYKNYLKSLKPKSSALRNRYASWKKKGIKPRPDRTQIVKGKRLGATKKINPIQKTKKLFTPTALTRTTVNAALPKAQITTPRKNRNTNKTVLKNVAIKTSATAQNINVKGKLSLAHVKIANGTTLKDTNIDAKVDAKNISVSKGSTADIGSVNIQK